MAEPQAEWQRDAAIGSPKRGNTQSRDHLTALNDRELTGPRPSSWRRAIGEEYLALCRDPSRDLLAWANATIEPEGAPHPHSTGKDTQQGGLPPPKTPRTVAEAIVEDYLELCRDPSRDILAWVNATMWDSPAGWRAQAAPLGQPPETAKTVAGGGGVSVADAMLDDSLAVCRNSLRDPGSAFESRKGHEGDNSFATHNPRSDDDRSGNGLRENALQAVHVRLEPDHERGSRSPVLSSRPAAGIQKYHALQSVQAGPVQRESVDTGSSGLASERSGSPGSYGAPGQTPEGRGPEESFDDGAAAQRELQGAFAELSRLVSRQLAEAAKTAPKHELAAIQRFIMQDRERGAAFLIREFRESRAHASQKKREQAQRPSEPLRPQATAPPELMAAQREARERIAAPS